MISGLDKLGADVDQEAIKRRLIRDIAEVATKTMTEKAMLGADPDLSTVASPDLVKLANPDLSGVELATMLTAAYAFKKVMDDLVVPASAAAVAGPAPDMKPKMLYLENIMTGNPFEVIDYEARVAGMQKYGFLPDSKVFAPVRFLKEAYGVVFGTKCLVMKGNPPETIACAIAYRFFEQVIVDWATKKLQKLYPGVNFDEQFSLIHSEDELARVGFLQHLKKVGKGEQTGVIVNDISKLRRLLQGQNNLKKKGYLKKSEQNAVAILDTLDRILVF